MEQWNRASLKLLLILQLILKMKQKDKMTYRDAAFLCLGIFIGIVWIVLVAMAVYTITLTHFDLNIGQVIIDINETRLVETMVQQMNNTIVR